MAALTPNPTLSLTLQTIGAAELRTHSLQPGSIQALTHGLAKGDEAAFSRFHELYFDRLYALLLVICRGVEEEASEALQQTLLRVVRYARPFESEEVFWSWLTTLARSAARDAGRKQQRYTALLRRFALSWWELRVTDTPQPEEERLRSVVNEVLQELPEEDRTLIAGKYIAGETVRELAAKAGLSEKAVESRLTRLRMVLRGRLLEKLRENE